MVSFKTVILSVSNIVFFFDAFVIYCKRPSHRMAIACISIFCYVGSYSILWHVCSSSQIGWCAKDPNIMLGYDTLFTYQAVTAAFVIYYPNEYAEKFFWLMFAFNGLVNLIFLDSFWTVFIIVPTSGFPMIKYGAKETILHPLVHWKSWLASGFGILGIYFKVQSGNDIYHEDYLTYHDLWHWCAGLSSALFDLDLPDNHSSLPIVETAKTKLNEVIHKPLNYAKQNYNKVPTPMGVAEKMLLLDS